MEGIKEFAVLAMLHELGLSRNNACHAISHETLQHGSFCSNEEI